MGHSNAQGDVTFRRPSFDERVSSISFTKNDSTFIPYQKTADPSYLPVRYNHLCAECGIAPFNPFPWFWSQLGDSLARHLNVPILFYSAAFGGSNMEQTFKSAFNIPFTHTFVNYSIRMPYANIRNTIQKYMPLTGLRGVLSAHGANDAGATAFDFYRYASAVILKSRIEAGQDSLAWMIAISAYNDGPIKHIVDAQNFILRRVPQTYQGPDLNRIGNTGRGNGDGKDHLHFNPEGQRLAAIYWSEALKRSPFLTRSTPVLPMPPKVPEPPATAQTDSGKMAQPGREYSLTGNQ